jgi:hypothetical protein
LTSKSRETIPLIHQNFIFVGEETGRKWSSDDSQLGRAAPLLYNQKKTRFTSLAARFSSDGGRREECGECGILAHPNILIFIWCSRIYDTPPAFYSIHVFLSIKLILSYAANLSQSEKTLV